MMVLRSPLLVVLLGFMTSFTLVIVVNRAFRSSTEQVPPLAVVQPTHNNTPPSRIHTLPAKASTHSPVEVFDIQGHSPAHQDWTCNGITFQATTDNMFLRSAFCHIPKFTDIVQFTGPRISELFDKDNQRIHVFLGNGMKARYWGDIARLISEVQRRQKQALPNGTNPDAAVQVHNYHKLGDFLLLFRDEYRRGGPDRATMAAGGPNALPLTAEQFHWAMDKGQPSVVITNWGDENWGAFSGPVNTRTAKWLNLTNHLKIHFSDYSTVRMLLDSPKVTLVVANTHVDPRIGNHTKLICVPLGMKARAEMHAKAGELLARGVNKTTVLRINNSGWGDRTAINALVSAAFNGTGRNSYSRTSRADHHAEAARAKFVLCPSGLGFDTYRLWETLLMGSIPVVESNAGFDRTYSNLPVLVVRNYSDVTPQLLQRAYPCFLRHARDFNYAHLTEGYWMDLVRTAVRTGCIDHVTAQHPFRNKYCDFL